jgi:hypothetical protein
MGKRGQLTIFIITALIIIISILTIISITNTRKNIIETQPQITTISDNIQDCLDKTAEDAIYHIGQTGGYFNLPNKHTSNSIAYHFYETKSMLPSITTIEQEISNYIDTMLPFCIQNFQEYPDYEITYTIPKTTTKINEKTIHSITNYQITITQQDKTYQLEEFSTIKTIRFDLMYSILKKMNDYQKEEPRSICINCIGYLAIENNLYIFLDTVSENETLIYIEDPETIINNETYIFYFANKYLIGDINAIELPF